MSVNRHLFTFEGERDRKSQQIFFLNFSRQPDHLFFHVEKTKTKTITVDKKLSTLNFPPARSIA